MSETGNIARSKQEENILKVRDDNEIINFYKTNEGEYSLSEGMKYSWLKCNDKITTVELRQRIEPWLTALFQSEHLSLLVGSGLTTAMANLTEQVAASLDKEHFSVFDDCIQNVAKISAEKAGRNKGNFEDEIRTANELLYGLQILQTTKERDIFDNEKLLLLEEKTIRLEKEISEKLQNFANSILTSERNIISNQDKSENAMNTLVNFLMSFASRNGTRDRLQIFTTNYDRILEEGADLAGLRLVDRFVGNLAPIFRSSRIDVDMHYNTPGIRGEPRYLEGVAHFTKLHGSIDWIQTGENIRKFGLPLGAESIIPYLNVAGLKNANAQKLMIYPNSSKDKETAQYPFVEMFRDFAAAICRPNSTVVTYGYSFGDDHINRVIRDMLTIPSTHLMIISFDDPLGRIIDFYKKAKRESQISLLIGHELGDITKLTKNYLPKSAIDKNSFRLNEILKERYNHTEKESLKNLEI